MSKTIDKDPIKAAWENGPISTALKKEFGGNYESYKAYFENDKQFKATGKVYLDKPAGVSEEYDANTPIEALKTRWDGDEHLRKEFGYNFGGYHAYVKHHKTGISGK